jgi:magnesium chelatase subunit I
MMRNEEDKTTARISDFWGVVPALTGKVEMVYEGEQEGAHVVALTIIGAALKKMFLQRFPNPAKLKRGQERDPYGVIKAWFAAGNKVDLLVDLPNNKFYQELEQVAGLRKLVEASKVDETEVYTFMELVLHGLSEAEVLSKEFLDNKWQFKDYLAGQLDAEDDDDMRDLFN